MMKTKKLVYTLLAVFLLAMMVMTLVSRIMNQSHIPEVETQTPRSSILVLDAIGRGVVRFGTPVDSRIEKKLFSEDTYYVEGYFFEKDSLKNVPEGSTIDLSVGGETLGCIIIGKIRWMLLFLCQKKFLCQKEIPSRQGKPIPLEARWSLS